MKRTALPKAALLITALLANGAALAYEPDKEAECKKPRFSDFNLTEYNATDNIQVSPEAEFFFKLPVTVDPSTITLTAKKRPLEFTVESNSSFHKVKSKLPASLTGQFVRIDASAKAILGCDNQHGWLVKISGH